VFNDILLSWQSSRRISLIFPYSHSPEIS